MQNPLQTPDGTAAPTAASAAAAAAPTAASAAAAAANTAASAAAAADGEDWDFKNNNINNELMRFVKSCCVNSQDCQG